MQGPRSIPVPDEPRELKAWRALDGWKPSTEHEAVHFKHMLCKWMYINGTCFYIGVVEKGVNACIPNVFQRMECGSLLQTVG